jgi:WD40 repeat protein
VSSKHCFARLLACLPACLEELLLKHGSEYHGFSQQVSLQHKTENVHAGVLALEGWPGESVTSLAFSPDGQLLAAGGAGGSVRIWGLTPTQDAWPGSLRAATPVPVPVGPGLAGSTVGSLTWVPSDDGSWLLLAGNASNSVLELWHCPVDAGAGGGLQFSPLQRLQFEASSDGKEFFNHVEAMPQVFTV